MILVWIFFLKDSRLCQCLKKKLGLYYLLQSKPNFVCKMSTHSTIRSILHGGKWCCKMILYLPDWNDFSPSQTRLWWQFISAENLKRTEWVPFFPPQSVSWVFHGVAVNNSRGFCICTFVKFTPKQVGLGEHMTVSTAPGLWEPGPGWWKGSMTLNVLLV